MPPHAAFAALALALLPAPAAARPVDAKALDDLVQKTIQLWKVPGAAVAVVRGDEVVYLKGFGARELGKKAPVTPDTVFPVGSCTKTFTTASMAVLVDRGQMAWDDPVRKHLPYFRLSDPLADREVRLRDLVCHRTGLAGHNLLWYRSPWSQEEVVRRAGRLPLSKPFRTAFQYQSTMFTAAGLAAAKTAGVPWGEFVQKELLSPLDMKATVLTSTAAVKAPDHAVGHRLGAAGRAAVMARHPLPVPEPAGSLHSSARDLAKWLRFHLGDGTAGKKRLLSAQRLAELHAPQTVLRLPADDVPLFPDTHQLSYAMGWVVYDHRGHKLLAHGGAIDGFRAHFTLVPGEKVGVVLLCNLHQTHMNYTLSNSILDVVLGLRRKDWNSIHRAAHAKAEAAADARDRARLAARHRDTKPSRELAAYAGDYQHPAYGTVRVAVERGALVWSWYGLRATLAHFHYDTFTLPLEEANDAEVVFTLDDAGGVRGMKVTGNVNVDFTRARPKAGAATPGGAS